MRKFRSTVHRTYPIKGRPLAHKIAIRGAAWIPYRIDVWLLHKGNLAIDRRNRRGEGR